jgi:hypothetical protein
LNFRPDSKLPNLRPLCAAIGCPENWSARFPKNSTELNRLRDLCFCAEHEKEFRAELRAHRMERSVVQPAGFQRAGKTTGRVA